MWWKSRHVTQSPHHWCASSCATTNSANEPRLVEVWCSMPPLNRNWAWPYFSSTNGYGPKCPACDAIIVFTLACTAAAVGAVSGKLKKSMRIESEGVGRYQSTVCVEG